MLTSIKHINWCKLSSKAESPRWQKKSTRSCRYQWGNLSCVCLTDPIVFSFPSHWCWRTEGASRLFWAKQEPPAQRAVTEIQKLWTFYLLPPLSFLGFVVVVLCLFGGWFFCVLGFFNILRTFALMEIFLVYQEFKISSQTLPNIWHFFPS